METYWVHYKYTVDFSLPIEAESEQEARTHFEKLELSDLMDGVDGDWTFHEDSVRVEQDKDGED